MKKMIVLVAALIASHTWAQAPKMAPKMAAPPTATSTKMDVMGDLKWTGYGVGKSHTGTLNIKSGQIEVKGDEIIGGEMTIDMTSLKTGDSPKLQTHLQSADFFDIQKYPEGKFKITKVEKIMPAAADAATHKITGDLTIKGKTHPETFNAKITKNGTKYAAIGETEIKDRTQYDIKYNSAKFQTLSALGDKAIEDKIKIQLNLTTK